jgi:hypothetical protein
MTPRRAAFSFRDGIGLAFALLLTGLAIYVAAILKAGEWSNLPNALGGSGSYFDHGRFWASGVGPLPNSRPPVYTLLVGLGFRFAPSEQAMKWLAMFHVGLTGLMLLAWYALVRLRSGSVLAACTALTLMALNLSMLREFLSGRETAVFSAIILLAFSQFSLERPFGPVRAMSLGILSALAWLTRPTGIVLIPVAGLLLWRSEEKASRSCAARLAACFALGVAFPLSVWAGYQSISNQSVTLAGKSSMLNLYLGNNEAFAATYPLLDIETFNERTRERTEAWKAEGKSPQAEMLRESIGFLAAHPLDGLRLALIKALAFLTPRHFPRGSGRLVQTEEGWAIEDYAPAPVLHDLLTIAALPGVLLLGLSLARWKAMPTEVHFTCLMVLLALGLHVLTFAETRFRQGFDPALAASGILSIMAAWRARSYGAGEEGDVHD